MQAAENDPPKFAQLFHQIHSAMFPGQSPYDPFDPQSQQRIEEIIAEQNIAENLASAMEFHPESFGSVTMLYIPCRVNDHHIKAFVDCGAQTTISNTWLVGVFDVDLVTEACAKRCELSRLIDKRFSGMAKGVGMSRIIGRVHSVQLEMGGLYLPCSVTIIEGDGPEMLLGLDMLKRHQCHIDLEKNVLAVNNVRISFLPESEIPKD